jgi:hypothetical protein
MELLEVSESMFEELQSLDADTRMMQRNKHMNDSSHPQTAAKVTARGLHGALVSNIQWVIRNKGKEDDEYHNQCAYIGRKAGERLALLNSQETLTEKLTNDGYIKINVCRSQKMLPLIQIMMDELRPILDEKDEDRTGISLCFSQVEACPLPSPDVLKKKAPTYFSFMESLHEPGCKSLFPDLPELYSQCLKTVPGLKVPKIQHVLPDYLAPHDQGAIHETPKFRNFETVKELFKYGYVLLNPHLDYDPKQVKRIMNGEDYKGKPTRHPRFIVMPLERPVSILVYGNKQHPNQNDNGYLGKLVRIEVGEMLICSWNLWHCTGPPIPLASVEVHGNLTYMDTRIHACFGFTREDIDETNLQPPDGERIWKRQFTCNIGCDTNQYESQYAMLLHEDRENRRKRKKSEPMLLRNHGNNDDG